MKDTVIAVPVLPVERQYILESMVASFRIEGIYLSDSKVRSIYARVNEKLKK